MRSAILRTWSLIITINKQNFNRIWLEGGEPIAGGMGDGEFGRWHQASIGKRNGE